MALPHGLANLPLTPRFAALTCDTFDGFSILAIQFEILSMGQSHFEIAVWYLLGCTGTLWFSPLLATACGVI